MRSTEIREKFIKFWQERGHTRIPSASVVPENDPSVLFTTAGMHPLVPFLLGERHPAGNRLVNAQKCIRTGDIDEVGDDTHLTFFEMLGNWSLGDYFKDDAIKWSYEFLTKELNIPPEKLAVSVFAGDTDAPRDETSAELWKTLGISDERIAYLGKEDNWWPAGGNNPGPQGPDTEMFVWIGEEEAPLKFDPADSSWVEVWNDVFMEFNKTTAGKVESLKQKNVDTGMGLERITAVMQSVESVYDTDLFLPIIDQIRKLSDLSTGSEAGMRSMRIIADHIRSAVVMIGDGVLPSNVEQGYVLRRLIRRAIREGKKLGLEQNFTQTVANAAIMTLMHGYPELQDNANRILEELEREEKRFRKTLERGLKMFDHIAAVKLGGVGYSREERLARIEPYRDDEFKPLLTGEEIFELFDTYGFPPELSLEEARGRGFAVEEDWEWVFDRKMEEQRDRSRTASAGQFKGGLADTSEKTTWYHTTAHLTYAALRKILGDHVHQRGSNITAERMRFDFSHPEKLTDEQKAEVEKYVNAAIAVGADVSFEEIPTTQALESGALGEFGHKYGDKVKVYTVKSADDKAWSYEICGGPHVVNTSDIKGTYRIKKEESVAAGIRRIKAVVE